MFTKVRTKLLSLGAALIMVAVPVLAPTSAFAADPPAGPNLQNDLGCGATFQTDPGATCDSTQGAGKVQGIVTTIVNYLSIIVGLLAVIMLIYGGLKYITSGGDSSKAASARSAIVYAVIGLVIVALAQVIVQFVLTKANPANTTGGTGQTAGGAGN
ncbi:MAG TPA: hypothetical protein VLG11_06300 [Candidatus Saccharimonadales bacterium]|nr:hypothetical protein [Candidatus Saccharimonadales bacterium]